MNLCVSLQYNAESTPLHGIVAKTIKTERTEYHWSKFLDLVVVIVFIVPVVLPRSFIRMGFCIIYNSTSRTPLSKQSPYSQGTYWCWTVHLQNHYGRCDSTTHFLVWVLLLGTTNLLRVPLQCPSCGPQALLYIEPQQHNTHQAPLSSHYFP